MKLIVITAECFFENESGLINDLFSNGLQILHLRKPASSEKEVFSLLENIHSEYYNRIVLHEHFGLVHPFGLKGVHLNRRNPIPPVFPVDSISKSCHQLTELEQIEGCSYVFLSPVFDSISKVGYKKAFTPEQLTKAKQKNILHEKVIALGGIEAENIETVFSYGFGGVAVLGRIWSDYLVSGDKNKPINTFLQLQKLCNQFRIN